MDAPNHRDWLAESSRHDITCVCENALHAAAGTTWQCLGLLAGGAMSSIGQDYLDPTRTIIAEYLRHTGRFDEAVQVLAVGCNEPPPPAMFASITPRQQAALRQALES
jgi:hypothetical protein